MRSDGMAADFTRTCAGCRHLQMELPEPARCRAASRKGARPEYYCEAPGPRRGYLMGIGRVVPYVPAWCPEKAGKMTAKEVIL